MTMAYEAWVQLIKAVSNEQGFKVEGGDFVFSVYIDRWHGIAYQLKVNSSGYVQAHQWEAKANDEGAWGRAVHSIRDFSGAVMFCQILINSARTPAGVPQ